MNYLYTYVFKNEEKASFLDIEVLIPFILIALFIGLFVGTIVKIVIKSRKDRKTAMEELLKPVEELPITEIDARVVKKECFVKTYGTRMPESRKEFQITFSTFTGEIKRFSVDEEFYLQVEENTVGTIALINDKFFDFYFEK